MRGYRWPGLLGILLGGILPFSGAAQVAGERTAQQRESRSPEEQMRQAESQLLRIAAEHHQVERAASNRWKRMAGGAIIAGLALGIVAAVRRRRSGR